MEEPATARVQRGAALIAVEREDLDLLSVEELQERIARLEGEIGRVRQAMQRKQAGKSAADALFSFGRS